MDGERKINLCEGVPLNSTGAANIFLNTGKSTKNSPGTAIHLNTEKPSGLGVHINTTFSIASSKKIKLLFVLNFLLSLVCMVICCILAFYFWSEMIAMRQQLDLMKDHCLIQNLNVGQEKIVQGALTRPRSAPPPPATREARMDERNSNIIQTAKTYYVEDLGDDMLLLDAKKKNDTKENLPTISILQRDTLVAHFNGAKKEHDLKMEFLIGPWVRDLMVSSKGSEKRIELNKEYFIIKESGLYLIYAQVVYLTKEANCYFIWARQTDQPPRQLSTCATGDVSTTRPRNQSQISCATQTVARLYQGDIVNLAQREPNRTLWIGQGYSHFGFVKLSS